MYMDPYMTQYNPYAGYGSVGMGMGMGGFDPYMMGMGGMGGFNPYMGGMGGMGMGGFNPYMGGMGMGMGGFNPYMMGMGGMGGGMGMGGFNPYMMGMGGMRPQFSNVIEQPSNPVINDTFNIQPPSPGEAPVAPMTAQEILQMAVGKIAPDMRYDANGDGRITSSDALAFHKSDPYAQGMMPPSQSAIQANTQQPNQITSAFEQPSQMGTQNALAQQMQRQAQQIGAGLNQRGPFPMPMGDTFIPSGNRAPTPFSSTMGRLGLGSQQPGQSPFGNQNTRKPIMGLGQRLGLAQQASPTQSTAQQASPTPQGVF